MTGNSRRVMPPSKTATKERAKNHHGIRISYFLNKRTVHVNQKVRKTARVFSRLVELRNPETFSPHFSKNTRLSRVRELLISSESKRDCGPQGFTDRGNRARLRVGRRRFSHSLVCFTRNTICYL